MTKTYALRRLLELGPLTMRQIVEITFWPLSRVRDALLILLKRGKVRRVHERGINRYVYRLACDAPPPGVLHESLEANLWLTAHTDQ